MEGNKKMLLNKRFTIGEMAKMHNIAESTLRYYDEKGIFIRPLWILKRIIVIIQSINFHC